MTAQDEWMKFLKFFQKSDRAAIAYLPKMKDAENIATAKRYLFPDRDRPVRTYELDAETKAHQRAMWNDSGFMPKLGDRKMGYR